MKQRPKWSTVVIALGVIAALGIASPVFGVSKNIKKAIKKEVSKQIAKATGPAGAPGAPGAPGAVRAYGKVSNHADAPCSPNCNVSRSSGISTATHTATGVYCVHVPGVSAVDVAAVVAVDYTATASPKGNTSAMVSNPCDGTGFEVRTERQAPIDVEDDPAPDGAESVADNAVPHDGVSFTIMVP